MDIVIVSQYLRDISNFEKNNSRFVYLAKLLKENFDANVEIITSDFCHVTKTHFDIIGKLSDVHITSLHEPGYVKNVTFKRIRSHKKLAHNLEKYLKKRNKPDIIYAAVPSLDVAEVCADYCKINNVKFIVDIQDLWPEAFKIVIDIPIISDAIFYPMKKQANKIYALADEIVAVSKTYLDRAMLINKKCKNPKVIYLGTDKSNYMRSDKDKTRDTKVKETESLEVTYGVGGQQGERSKVTIAYCGTLGHSYDITCVFEALRMLEVDISKQLQFIIMGDGPQKQNLQKKSLGLPVVFTGRLPYPEMVKTLTGCDIAINPIVKGAAQSIINKHMDYAMAGLPVINTQECQEYRALLSKYEAGINCECGNASDVADAIRSLVTEPGLRERLGENSLRLGEELFDRSTTYKQMLTLF